MTINGIWEWANHVSQKVSLETLRGKVLSIDGHIWLYESLKGCESHHQQTPNSYLVTFFSRIQRLRELRITPIVVFDTCNAIDEDHEEFVTRKKRGGWDSPLTNLMDSVIRTHMLLVNLGVRVIFAPGDGEAQCAQLEAKGDTSGCITTDFDYFLFGGKNLYRFDFTQSATSSAARLQDVTHLSLGKMGIEKKIARPHLISTAILLGCDYFQRGVQGIGLVTVFDILAEFGDDGSEDVDPHVILDRFASYVREEIPARSEDSPRKLRLRRKTYNFQQDFPNCDAVQTAVKMYMKPKVLDDEQLACGRRDRLLFKPDEVEKVLTMECGWTMERVQKEFGASIRRSYNIKNQVSQSRIPEFFASTKFTPLVEPCKSVNEYISASSAHIRKRKHAESPSRQQKIPPKRVMLPVDTGRRRSNLINIPQRQTYPTGVIELDSD